MRERLLEKLRSKFSDSILSVEPTQEVKEGPDVGLSGRAREADLLVTIKKNDIVAVSQFLRDDEELRFDSLRDVVGVDQYRPEDRFEIVYNLYSIPNNFRFFLKIRIDESDARVATLSHIWPAANWAEREVYDMFGIAFEGHPDLRRIYMPEEFEYYPLRKEFPLMGVPGSIPLPPKY